MAPFTRAQFLFEEDFVSFLAHFRYNYSLETRWSVDKLNPVTFCYRPLAKVTTLSQSLTEESFFSIELVCLVP